MQVHELVSGIERHWGNVPWDKDNAEVKRAVLQDYLSVLGNVKPVNLARAWERLLETRDKRQGHPLPGDVMKFVGPAASKDHNWTNYRDYMNARPAQLVREHEEQNQPLWNQAGREIWDHWMWSDLKDRAEVLALAEYRARHENINFDVPGNDISPDEIVDAITLKLNPTNGQVKGWRKARSKERAPQALKFMAMAKAQGIDLYGERNG